MVNDPWDIDTLVYQRGKWTASRWHSGHYNVLRAQASVMRDLCSYRGSANSVYVVELVRVGMKVDQDAFRKEIHAPDYLCTDGGGSNNGKFLLQDH